MQASHELKLIFALAILLVGCSSIMAQRRNRAANTQPAPAASPTPATPSNAPHRHVSIKLKNGDPINGNFLGADSNGIQVEVAGNRLNIKIDDVATIDFLSDASKTASSEPAITESQPSATPSPTPDNTSQFIGTWALQMTGQGGQSVSSTLTIYRGADGLNCILEYAGQKTPPSKCTIDGNDFNASFTSIEQGQAVPFTLSGHVDKDQMTGSLNASAPNTPAISFTGSRTSADITSAATQSVGSGQLAIQVGIVYRIGGAQPVARTQFYLLDQSLETILLSAGVKPNKNIGLINTWGLAVKYPSSYRDVYQRAQAAIQQHIVKSTTTDFNGLALFDPVTPGTYYVMGFAQTRGGFAIWNVRVDIPSGQYSLILDQNNAATSF